MKLYIRAAIFNILDEDADTQSAIAEDPSTDPEVLDELSHSQYSWVVFRALKNPNIDVNTLNSYIEAMLNNGDSSTALNMSDVARLLKQLAGTPSLDNSTFDLLADFAIKYPNTYIAITLAENPNSPESTLLRLTDYDTHAHAVMDPIIKHPNVTLEVLRQLLIKDAGHCGYMKNILKTHQVPEEFLWEFIHNGTEYDRRSIANSTQASSEMLSELIQTDNDVWISGDAIKNPNLSEDTIWDIFNTDRASTLVWNPNCPSEILKHFATKWISEDNSYSLGEVAQHANTPIDSLYQIFDAYVGDSSWSNPICYLAENPNIPDDMASQIAAGTNDRAKVALARNPNVSPDILGSLVKSKIDIRKALAKNPNTPPKALIKLAKDRSDEVKYIVGENPNLPEEGYLRLLQDPRAYCRWGLEHNPTYKERYEREKNG